VIENPPSVTGPLPVRFTVMVSVLLSGGGVPVGMPNDNSPGEIETVCACRHCAEMPMAARKRTAVITASRNRDVFMETPSEEKLSNTFAGLWSNLPTFLGRAETRHKR
jgi:hypothetical protein